MKTFVSSALVAVGLCITGNAQSKPTRPLDRQIRDVIVAAYPELADRDLHLTITAEAGTLPAIASGHWYFSVEPFGNDRTFDIHRPFLPDIAPCWKAGLWPHGTCSPAPRDAATRILEGRIALVHGVTYFTAVSPRRGQLSMEFRRALPISATTAEMVSALINAGARFPPSKADEIDKIVQRLGIQKLLGLEKVQHAQFCIHTQTLFLRPVQQIWALYWLALAKQKSGEQYAIVLEPFEGTVTAVIPVRDRELKWMCKP